MTTPMSETSSRLLELLSLLQARRDWPGSELADRLEVSGRTIRRDIERLRELGYPVESLTGPAGGYRLRAGTAMPPLLLDDDEAIAIAVGLRTAARASVTGIEETAVRALVKLEQVLPGAPAPPRHARWARRRSRRRSAGPTVDPQHLTVIAAACRDRECLRFAYRSRDGTDSRRDGRAPLARQPRPPLVPRRLGPRPRGLAHLPRRPAEPSPASTGVRFAPRTLPAKDAAAYVEQSITGAPNRFEARVTLHAPADEIAGRVPPHWGTIEPIDAAQLRVPHRRRRPRLARAADRDARRRLRGPRAARAGRAPAGAGRPPAASNARSRVRTERTTPAGTLTPEPDSISRLQRRGLNPGFNCTSVKMSIPVRAAM